MYLGVRSIVFVCWTHKKRNPKHELWKTMDANHYLTRVVDFTILLFRSGCIAAMGGGTLNNILYGSSALLLDRPGVFWVRVPAYATVSIVASVATFYLWPQICRRVAKHELEQCIGKQNLNRDGSVSRSAFIVACQRDAGFAKSVAAAFGMDPVKVTPQQLFSAADMTRSGTISLTEMEALVAKQFDASPTMYALDVRT